jgi:hypothetical protein
MGERCIRMMRHHTCVLESIQVKERTECVLRGAVCSPRTRRLDHAPMRSERMR